MVKERIAILMELNTQATNCEYILPVSALNHNLFKGFGRMDGNTAKELSNMRMELNTQVMKCEYSCW